MNLNKIVLLCALAISGCNKDAIPNNNEHSHEVSPDKPVVSLTEAQKWKSESGVLEKDSNQSIFITNYEIPVDLSLVRSVAFKIEPKFGTVAEPFGGVFSASYFKNNGYDKATSIVVPVYGMYSNYDNTIDFKITFNDGSVASFKKALYVPEYKNLNHKLEKLDTTDQIEGGNKVSFSYFAMQSKTSQGMVIADVDGNIRWVFNELEQDKVANRSGLFFNGEFVRQRKSDLVIQTLTGVQRVVPIKTNIERMYPNHEISIGKTGIFTCISGYIDGVRKRESVVIEVNPNTGEVIHTWDLGEILTKAIVDGGESPDDFVGKGIVRDWFHMNSVIYDKSDDSIIVSSRENFVIKLDYKTGDIKWIFGDETKMWGQYASLMAFAISTKDIPPIGQHSLSIEKNGDLLMFNNGHESEHQPDHKLTGESLATSLVTAYKVDSENKTADLTWSYDGGVKCDICSSAYRKGDDYLITYSSVDMHNRLLRHEEIKIVDNAGGLKAGFRFNGMCLVWNTKIINPNIIYK